MVRGHQVYSGCCVDHSLDAAILAQVNVDKFSSPPQKFLTGLIRYCATKIPMLNADLGVTNPRGDITESLAAIAAKEKSWTHRFIDQSKFLRTHLAKVSKLSTLISIQLSLFELLYFVTHLGILSYEEARQLSTGPDGLSERTQSRLSGEQSS